MHLLPSPGLCFAESAYCSCLSSVNGALLLWSICYGSSKSLGTQACVDDEAGAVASDWHSVDPQGKPALLAVVC